MTDPKDAASPRSRDSSWHSMAVDEAAASLKTSRQGLSRNEVARRLDEYGPNQLEEEPQQTVAALILHQFRSPLIYILVIAAIVTLALEEYIDVAVITAVLVLNAVIGFTQERKAETSVRSLIRMSAPHARVIRDGSEHDIESRELVPGDLVLIESGSRVPADLRLTSTTALQIDESAFTGESDAVQKQADPIGDSAVLADRTNMAFAGTAVASGRGRGYVVSTGERTQIGGIASQVRSEVRLSTPLQQKMARFASAIGVAVGASALLAFAIGIVRGESGSDMFMVAVTLAVAAIPEGLPVVSTITLAVGVRRMANRNAIIRRLPAVETLGSTTCIGSDKTGTLTENRMTVTSIWSGGQVFDVSSESKDGITPEDPNYLTLLAGVLSNEAAVAQTDHGWETQGDPTEAALLIAATHLGMEPEEIRDAYHIVAEIPFEPDRQFAASYRENEGKRQVYVKGAPERLVQMSSSMLQNGREVPLDENSVHTAADDLASQGLRVLAMAYREIPADHDLFEGTDEPHGLVLVGMQGMMDPPREGVRDAITACNDAGIRVVMVTGDHAATARSIGHDLGISDSSSKVLTGADLANMEEADLRSAVHDVAIYARVAPDQKLRVVRALQSEGDVVAVTGDGVNDAPALKAADIGVAMGRSGTDVAREAADMVLSDDNFVSIVAAVEEGRITFDNVRKASFFLIGTGAATVLTIIAALVAGWPIPFLPAQMLWLNLVTNGLQDVALAFEPGDEGILQRRPRPRREGVISRLLWERTVIVALVLAAGTLALFKWELDRSGSLALAQTVALTTMVVFQAFQAGNARSETRSLFRMSPFSNRLLIGSTVVALAVHVGALYWGPTQTILRVEPIDAGSWVRIVLVASTILAASELHKFLRRRYPIESLELKTTATESAPGTGWC